MRRTYQPHLPKQAPTPHLGTTFCSPPHQRSHRRSTAPWTAEGTLAVGSTARSDKRRPLSGGTSGWSLSGRGRPPVPGECMGPEQPDPPCQATAWGPNNPTHHARQRHGAQTTKPTVPGPCTAADDPRSTPTHRARHPHRTRQPGPTPTQRASNNDVAERPGRANPPLQQAGAGPSAGVASLLELDPQCGCCRRAGAIPTPGACMGTENPDPYSKLE
jgi:hypothetical protein